MRLNYPSSVRIIRVPCTGKVDVLHILRCFERGADGVYVVGCREGDCHYQSGNFRAKKRVEQAQHLLDRIGIGGQRVRMCNLSSSDARGGHGRRPQPDPGGPGLSEKSLRPIRSGAAPLTVSFGSPRPKGPGFERRSVV
jgi:F420-non-reducing hydrogenase iron-sulfur subunit